MQPGCVVAVGGSAGALESIERFFRSVPDNVDASFVVVQHMGPTQKSLLPELLARWTKMPVEVAKTGTVLQPRHVYVCEPGAALEIDGGHFVSHRRHDSESRAHPIDFFLNSLAAAFGARAIGVVLSGTGTDGTNGLRRIRENGGRVLVQDPSEAKFDGMPGSAIASGLADRVLPAEGLAKELYRFVECQTLSVSEREHTAELGQVCEILHRRTGHDFSSYKKGTVARRVERRLQANVLPNLASYIEFLERDPGEPRALLRDLLISVTQFFRDPVAFTALQEEVIPKLFDNANRGDSVRVWVPACATGEEAYTLAILILSYQHEKHPQVPVQIFATDIDRPALEYARHGLYPPSVAEHVPEKYLERFFRKQEKGYQISQELREICIFSEHSLLKHPPFSKIDLISCRNLFIYWEPDLQSKFLPVFHYSLNPDGFLFLGPAESVGLTNELFKVVDKKNRIFQRVGGISRSHLFFPVSSVVSARSPAPTDVVQRTQATVERDAGKAISSALLESYAPPAFVVSEHGEIAYYSGRTWRYIEPPTGVPSNNIFDVIARSLRPELHALLHRCIKSKTESAHAGLLYEREGSVQRLNLAVRPLDDFGLYLVILQEVASPMTKEQALGEGETLPGSNAVVQQLEEELRDTRERLQSTIEEVKSSNEELLSMNEELQSANEELQTSKEELQSTNEELETVNSELAKKVEELDSTNSDLQNFFYGTQVPILFLDREFRIQKFTPATTRIFRLIPSDLGRGILDITSLVEGSDLIADCARVLETLQPLDREMRAKDQSAVFLMRVSPYRTLSNVIAGVIVTFSEITELKKAHEIKSTLAAIVDSTSDAIVGRDLEGNVTSWNAGAERVFGFSVKEAIGKPITLIIPPDKQEEFRRLEQIVLQGQSISNHDTQRIRKDGRRILVSKTMSPIRGERGEIVGVSVIYRDVSEKKRAEFESARLAAIVRYSNDAMISKNLDGIIESWNEAATALFGYTADEIVGKSIKTLIPTEMQHEEEMILSTIRQGRQVSHYETERRRKDGALIQVSVSVSPILNSEGEIIGASKVVRDITQQKKTEGALKEALRVRDEFLSIASHELKTPLTSLKIQNGMRRRKILRNDTSIFSREALRKMVEGDEKQITRLTRLIDDMLDIARINSGKLSVTPEPVDLEMLVREVLDRLQESLEEAQCKVELVVRSKIEGHWDRFRIEQVVTNLLNNALRYGAGSPILVRIDSEGQWATLSVTDHGIGIAEQDQARIFKQFERAVSRNEITGLGLGLYIVKEILKMHGGEIQVESELGKGSTFIVTLPLHRKGDA